MSNLNEMLDLRSKLERWGEITIKNWQESLDKNGIGHSGDLSKSYEQQVKGATDSEMEIALKFKMYGRFRDMQVHKGVKAYERNQNNSNRTAARRYGANVSYSSSTTKRWYNKPKMAQIHRMREIMGIDLGEAVSEQFNQLTSEINNNIVNY